MYNVNELSDKEKALLNKIFRAVHDKVCPGCGFDMQLMGGQYYNCGRCYFQVSVKEMICMEFVVREWGREAVMFFEKWRVNLIKEEIVADKL